MRAIEDISRSVSNYKLVSILGWQDISQRYKRSKLGAFWLTLSMGVLIACIGLVFGQILGASIKEFLPFLTLGLILWTFILTSITESSTAFIDSEAIIKEIPIPLYTHCLRVLWRNMIILGHNIVIFPLVFIWMGVEFTLNSLLFIPGFFLLLINLSWISLFVAVLSTRFRDIPQLISNVFQVVFYLTPIIWLPNLLEGKREAILIDLNPIFHLIEIIRGPLLGQTPTMLSWTVGLLLALIGWSISLFIYSKSRKRIAYWL